MSEHPQLKRRALKTHRLCFMRKGPKINERVITDAAAHANACALRQENVPIFPQGRLLLNPHFD